MKNAGPQYSLLFAWHELGREAHLFLGDREQVREGGGAGGGGVRDQEEEVCHLAEK